MAGGLENDHPAVRDATVDEIADLLAGDNVLAALKDRKSVV